MHTGISGTITQEYKKYLLVGMFHIKGIYSYTFYPLTVELINTVVNLQEIKRILCFEISKFQRYLFTRDNNFPHAGY